MPAVWLLAAPVVDGERTGESDGGHQPGAVVVEFIPHKGVPGEVRGWCWQDPE